jgi:hypothetical protein
MPGKGELVVADLAFIAVLDSILLELLEVQVVAVQKQTQCNTEESPDHWIGQRGPADGCDEEQYCRGEKK